MSAAIALLRRTWLYLWRLAVLAVEVFVPPPAGLRESKEASKRDDGGGGGAGAADDEFAHPCPICLDNEDDAYVNGHECGQCQACGQMYCGSCNVGILSRVENCPTCRAPLHVSDEESCRRVWRLVHNRSWGRHTLPAQNSLGNMHRKGAGVKQDRKGAVEWYKKAAAQGHAHAQTNLGVAHANGHGVKQNYTAAAAWFRLAAEQGSAKAQHNLGCAYFAGHGVPRDFAEASKWSQLAADQGHANALKTLDLLQQHSLSPTPPPGTVVKPGRVAVLLMIIGAATLISFKLMNLRV